MRESHSQEQQGLRNESRSARVGVGATGTSGVSAFARVVSGCEAQKREKTARTRCDHLLSDVSYLEHSEANVRSLAREVSPRIAQVVYDYTLEKYAEKLEPLYDDASLEIVVQRGLWFLSEFLLSVGCNFYSTARWHDFIADHPKVMQHVILSDGILFEAVGKRARDYIVSYNIAQVLTL